MRPQNGKTAVITGLTGQDGSYLSELLLEKGYKVRGLIRRSSTFNTGRIDHILAAYPPDRFDFTRGDITDSSSLIGILQEGRPDEIYNFSAQSHVRVSFDIPVYSVDTAGLGVFRLLEAVRLLGLKCRIYQAGSSEMYGATPPPQNELTAFQPRSPYAIAKVAAHHACVNYREAYGMWISNGILFNHESPRRGETFVTRKISIGVARIALGIQDGLRLGNLDARRDWGYAPEYVDAIWRMLQQEEPDDYVIATGQSHTVREFATAAFRHAGFTLSWQGTGINERALDARTNRVLVTIDPRLFRPTEVEHLRGDCTKARNTLGWDPKVKFEQLVGLMVDGDMRRERMLLEGTKSFKESWRTHI